MKKLLTAVSALLLSSAAFAAVDMAEAMGNIQAAAQTRQKELQMQHSAGSHEKGVLPVKLTVSARVESAYAKVDPLEKDCPVVRISSHYLLGSMACVGLSEQATIAHSGGGSGDIVYSHPKVTRFIDKAVLNGATISKDHIFTSKENKIFLLRIDPANERLAQVVQNKPAVNLFVPQDPQVLKDLFSSKLNEECKKGRTCSDVNIAEVCTQTGCFKLGRKHGKGKTGDPVFGLVPDQSTEEFLLGFNITDVDLTTRKAGKSYQFFSPAAFEFIQQSVGKESADWAQIKRKQVSESYFQAN